MNLIISEVLEVLSIRESEKMVNGVRVITRYVELSTSEGTIKCKVGSGVEILKGYSGKAICLLRSVNSTVQYGKSAAQPVTYFQPVELLKWEQGNPVKKDINNLLSGLLTSKK